jgi:TonB-linked SusC/RagA family outer membrane protein
MRKIFLLFAVLLLLGNALKAQTRTITGQVVSSDKNEPLVGVAVQVKGSTAGTATDTSGRYSIKVTNLQSVVIGVRYIGYAYQEKTLRVGENNADFKLVASSSNLEEVVVVGYGTQKKIHLTGAVATINVKAIEDIPTGNLSVALRGQIPGLSQSGGTQRPGQPASLTIRNPYFFSKDGGTTDPLYIIDDVFRTSADFNLLDASEIENISILKDAAAAIYGIQGNNGVIIVKTKRGKAGTPKVNFSTSVGTANATQLPKMMSGLQLATYLNDAAQAKYNNTIDDNGYIGGVVTNKLSSWYTPDELNYFSQNNNNYLKQAFKTALVERGALNISGGNDKVTYFAGANYTNQNSNFEGVRSNKLGFRASVDAKLTKRLKISLSVSNEISNSRSYWYKLKSTTESLDNDVLSLTYAAPWTKFFIDGNPVLQNSTLSGSGAVDNVNYFLTSKSNNYTQGNNYILNALANISYQVPGIKGLTANASFNKNNNNAFNKQYGTTFNYASYSGTGDNNHIPGGTLQKFTAISNGDIIRLNPLFSNSYQFNASLNYDNKFGKHELSVLALYEQEERHGEGVAAAASGVIVGAQDNQNFTNGIQTSNQSSQVSNYGRLAYAGRVNYSYADKYLVEVLMRADANTHFAQGHQWGYFPSGSLGWVASEEGFIKDNWKFIDLLKFRASVGLLGSDNTKAYQYQSNYQFGTGSNGGAVFGLPSGERGNGLAPNNAIPNPNLTWDSNLKTNYGVDMQFLNNRLSVSADYFWNHGYNMLSNLTSSVSVLIGAVPSSENFASINTFGYEISVSWKDKIGSSFTYNFSPYFSWSDNKILKYDLSNGLRNTIQDLTGKSSDNGVLGYKYEGFLRTQADVDAFVAANPNYTLFGAANTPKPGMLVYKDVDGDGKMTTGDLTYLSHKASNHYNLGLNWGGAFKSLTLNVVMGLSFGGTAAVEGAATKMATATENRPVFWADHWTPANTNAANPSPYYSYDYDLTSDFWFKNSLSFRVSSVNLGYAFPQRFVSKIGVASLRAYVVATNPVNFFNPFDYRDNAVGYTSYPNLKTFSFGLNVGF